MVDRQVLARLDARRPQFRCDAGGAAPANRRIAVSPVAPIQPGMNAPSVLALLGSQPPRTSRELTDQPSIVARGHEPGDVGQVGAGAGVDRGAVERRERLPELLLGLGGGTGSPAAGL